MSTLNSPVVRHSPQTTAGEFTEKLKAGWVVLVLLVSGVFALISAILISWPALAFIAARFFQ